MLLLDTGGGVDKMQIFSSSTIAQHQLQTLQLLVQMHSL